MNKSHLLLHIGLLSSICFADQSGISYKQLKYWYMCSQGLDNESLVKTETEQKLFSDEKQEADFTLSSFSHAEKVMQIHDILDTLKVDYFTSLNQTKNQTDSLVTLMRDLEIYYGEGQRPEVNLASIVDRTMSASGATVLRKMLAAPADVDRLIKRQQFIKQLISDEALFNKIDDLCASWACNEDRMLSNWQKMDEVGSKQLDECYFQYPLLKQLNNNPHVMELRTRLGNLGTAYQFLGEIIIFGAIDLSVRKFIHKQSYTEACMGVCTEDLPNTAKSIYAMMFHPMVFCEDNVNGIRLQRVRDQLTNPLHYNPEGWDLAEKMVKGVSITYSTACWALTALKAYTLKQAYTQAKHTKDAINFVQNRLIGLGHVVRSVTELEELNQQYSVIAESLVSWNHAGSFLHSDKNKNFCYLVDLLQKQTFEGDASFFSFSGRVLAAQKIAEQEKDNFAGAIELIGELDACLSIAKLYKQFQERSVGYCLAELSDADRPHIKLTKFWNPFIDYTVVVPNDIELGGQKRERVVILTGSNTGGKSTVGLKGSLISLYLAHTLGIAPADECQASLFTDFCSYLHVLDDVASGESSFQAEVNRANSLVKAVKQLPKDQYAFIVIDELFKGTAAEKGASGAYKVIDYLAAFDNVICIIATHFKDLTQLPTNTDGHCINMKIDVYEDEQGNLVRPFRLEYGVSDRNVAGAIMQSHLDDIAFDM